MILVFDALVLVVAFLALIIFVVYGFVELFGIDLHTIKATTTRSIYWDEQDFLSVGWKVMFGFGLGLELLTQIVPSLGKRIKSIFTSMKFWSYAFIVGSLVVPLAVILIMLFVPDEARTIDRGFLFFVTIFMFFVHLYAYVMYMIYRSLQTLADRFTEKSNVHVN